MHTVVAAVAVLLIAIVLDADHFRFMTNPEVQVVAGTIVVATLLFDSVLAGVILGVSILIMYVRVYAKTYGITLDLASLFNTGKSAGNGKYPMRSLVTDYITPEHLKDAQDNIFDETNFSKEMVGVRGVYGEPVYSAQGTERSPLGTVIPGYDSYAPGSFVPGTM